MSQSQLRKFSFLGFTLIIVWLFSSIGGQGSLWQLSIVDASTEELMSLIYMVPDGNTTVRLPSYYIDSHIMQNAMFLALLLGSPATKASIVHFRNNIKIPMIKYYEDATSNDSDDCFNLESQSVPWHKYSPLGDFKTLYPSLSKSESAIILQTHAHHLTPAYPTPPSRTHILCYTMLTSS
jgi:hypothetical protein